MAKVPMMKCLLGRLHDAGFPRKYVREQVLPSWWDERLVETTAGYHETVAIIARQLSVDVESLLDPTCSLRPQPSIRPRFKGGKAGRVGGASPAVLVAQRCLRMVASAMDQPAQAVPPAEALRDWVLQTHSRVSLAELLDFAWSGSIPVLHLANLPSSPKPQAIATVVDERPAIGLCDGHQSRAWQAFHLAHELGHLYEGHVQSEATIVDTAIESLDGDADEQKANAYAQALLLGRAGRQYQTSGATKPTPRSLAESALATAERDHNDAAIVVFNLAFHDPPKWPLAMAAARGLDGADDGICLVQDAMVEHVNWEQLRDDDADFLARVTGVELDRALLPR